MKVFLNEKEVDFEAAVNLMDDELREEIHEAISPCGEQEFLDAYAQKHAAKFNDEEFTVN